MTVEYLSLVADTLLDAAADALVAATTGHAAPTSEYVGHGPPTGDYCCDNGEISVWLDTNDPEDAGLASTVASAGSIPQVGCALLQEATFVVSLRRCWPTGKDAAAPASTEVDAAAGMLLIDLWALLTELWDRAKAGTLLPAAAGQDNTKDARLGSATMIEPQGGCAGWDVRVHVRLNDTGPEGS